MRDIDAGQETRAAQTFTDGSKALSVIQDIADTELGTFFVSADGKATFQDRDYRQGVTASLGTFSDEEGGGIEYLDLVPSFDWDRVRNEWLVSPDSSVVGGSAQRAADDTSIRRFGLQTNERSTGLTSNADALAQAQYLVARTAAPALRIEEMRLEPIEGYDAWQQVFKRELSDQVTVVRHPGAGSTVSQASVVEAVGHDVDPERWLVTWETSPADLTALWTLNDATLGQLDMDNRLAY